MGHDQQNQRGLKEKAEMTNIIYTIENVEKLTKQIKRKFPNITEEEARGYAEFALKYNKNNEWPEV